MGMGLCLLIAHRFMFMRVLARRLGAAVGMACCIHRLVTHVSCGVKVTKEQTALQWRFLLPWLLAAADTDLLDSTFPSCHSFLGMETVTLLTPTPSPHSLVLSTSYLDSALALHSRALHLGVQLSYPMEESDIAVECLSPLRD